ncbi:response regulator transcription factor [Halarcobacter ebronensis]|uniref:DNA-binding response regulator n=1 Tax=Halarcobacter ebronensis TaxID=1462615 RepID=A0A4Q1ANT3_9BACT|nr:response regulator transcription factor [Halarcobacter ebronensis]QKF83438.1 two-component system response regulator [Halarcobacter ebronensis]RXK08239.1 DNA-binding response regulator [Halarcobacter ebronensis]
MKVLILEDDESLLDLIKEILEDKGLEVACFKDGLEAYKNCFNGFDCFILDINVPNMDGLTLLKKIRLTDKWTPAIIISANSELENLKKAYSSGCNDFIKKPFYMYELEQKIQQWAPLEKSKKLINGFTYDIQTDTLFNEQKEALKLTQKERRFLFLLIKNENRITSSESIENYVWEGEKISSMALRSMVKRLRTKLPEGMIISHNFGYEIKTF